MEYSLLVIGLLPAERHSVFAAYASDARMLTLLGPEYVGDANTVVNDVVIPLLFLGFLFGHRMDPSWGLKRSESPTRGRSFLKNFWTNPGLTPATCARCLIVTSLLLFITV